MIRSFGDYITGNGTNQNYSQEIIGHWMAPGATTTFHIKVTMLTGSNPVIHHAFFIDATENQKTAPLMKDEKHNYPQD